MEQQQLENLVDKLRCTMTVEWFREDPHCKECWVEVSRGDLRDPVIGRGIATKKKDAKRQAIMDVLPKVRALSDPCEEVLDWVDLWKLRLKKPIVAFQRPPAWWFDTPQVLGVDWEGDPPVLVQIACEAGVYIDRTTDSFAKSILEDKRHTHCVFGAHEVPMCANGVNVQQNKRVGLAEQTSRTWCPLFRLVKQRPLDLAWDSPPLPFSALQYAAMDAEVTRRFGLRRGYGSSVKQ